jgi:hypothetical protein
MSSDLDGVVWRKSSYSGSNGGECVELANVACSIGVRDSKNPEAHLIFGHDEMSRFLGNLRCGQFNG